MRRSRVRFPSRAPHRATKELVGSTSNPYLWTLVARWRASHVPEAPGNSFSHETVHGPPVRLPAPAHTEVGDLGAGAIVEGAGSSRTGRREQAVANRSPPAGIPTGPSGSVGKTRDGTR